jgi:hypothetical protein
MHMKLHKLAEKPKTPRLRPLTQADCVHVLPLLNKHLSKFDYVPQFSPVCRLLLCCHRSVLTTSYHSCVLVNRPNLSTSLSHVIVLCIHMWLKMNQRRSPISSHSMHFIHLCLAIPSILISMSVLLLTFMHMSKYH